MTGSVVLFGAAVAVSVLAMVVGAVLVHAASPCDGGPGGLPVLLLLAGVVGAAALPITTAVTGSARVTDVVCVAVVMAVGIPAVAGGAGWAARELRLRRVRRGVR